ncbi:MAG: OsmC family protein [Janthinobacterium lividum]
MPRHNYPVTVAWTGNLGTGTSAYDAYSRSHLIRIAGKEAIEGSSDPAFHGDATRHNPEEMLVASVSSCHMLWYLHLCMEQGVVVTGYSDEAQGTMEEHGMKGGKFTEIVLRPKVTIGAGGDIKLAQSLHEAAHKLCFVANSLSVPLRCEAQIEYSVA